MAKLNLVETVIDAYGAWSPTLTDQDQSGQKLACSFNEKVGTIPPMQISWRQVRAMTTASIRSRYRNTVAGLLWVVISPLMMYGAQAFAFKYVLKIDFENYPLFLLTGLIPWIFLIQSVQMGTTLFSTHARLYKSFPIHPLVGLISMVIDNLINFTAAFLLLLVPVALITGQNVLIHFIWLPLPLLSVFTAAIGLSWFLATSQIFFHDTKYVVDFVVSIAFYLTPIFYPASFVDARFRWITEYNPLATLFGPLQALSRSQLPENYPEQLAASYAVSISVVIVAFLFWRKKRDLAYFYL